MPDGNLTQVVRDVLQLFSSRGGRFTVFPAHAAGSAVHSGQRASQRPGAGVRRHTGLPFSGWHPQPLCSFAGQDAGLFASLPVRGVGIALQMPDGSTRVLRMSQAWSAICGRSGPPICWQRGRHQGEEVLRVLLYQDNKQMPMISLLEKALGDRTAALLGERAAPDTLVLTPRTVSGAEMLDAVCTPVGIAGKMCWCWPAVLPMLELVRAAAGALRRPMPRRSCALPPNRSP